MIAPEAAASRVRLATPGDEEPLFAMCKELHKENALKDPLGERITFDDCKVRRTLHRALYPRQGNDGTYAGHQYPAWIGVVGPEGSIEGSVYLAIETPWFSNHLILVQLWCFVLPAFRASTNLKDMVAFSRQFSDTSNVRPLVASVDSAGSEAAKCRQYRRQMGEPIAATFVYEGGAL